MDKNTRLLVGLSIVIVVTMATVGAIIKVGLCIVGMWLMLTAVSRMGSEGKPAAIEKAQAPNR